MIAIGIIVKIAFESGRRYRLPVIVTHVSRRGFGLAFNIFDQKLFRAFEAKLYGFDDSAQLGSRRIGTS